jgi:hypothetical protein
MFGNFNLLAPGAILGVFSGLGMISTATGHPAMGAVLSDPHTANIVTQILSAILGVAGGMLPGAVPITKN